MSPKLISVPDAPHLLAPLPLDDSNRMWPHVSHLYCAVLELSWRQKQFHFAFLRCSYFGMRRPSENDEIFGWDRNGFWKDEHIIVSEYLLIFSALLCCSLLIQHFTGHVWKCHYLPEAAATMILGMTISLTIRMAGINQSHITLCGPIFFCS